MGSNYVSRMVTMKTTVDIRDDLLMRAKQVAAARHQSLKSVIEDSLHARLGQEGWAGHRGGRQRTIKWVTARGGLPKGLNVTNRAEMHEWIRGSG